MPEITTLPLFEVTNQAGETVTSNSLQGTWSVLYFYPKDDTSGCTAEACSIRDAYKQIRDLGVLLYGVSPDSEASHRKFIEKFTLPFPLLSDPTHALAEAFHVWVEKSMYGKKYLGIERSTFIINPEGQVVGAYRKVKPEGHADFILGELSKLMTV